MILCQLLARQLNGIAGSCKVPVNNDKRHAATGQTTFELNFGRHPWKDNFVVQMEFPRLEELLTELQKSWEQATKSMEEA